MNSVYLDTVKYREFQGAGKIEFKDQISIISNNGSYVSHPDEKRVGNGIVESDPWAGEFLKDIREGKGFSTTNYSKTLNSKVIRIGVPIRIGHTATPWAALVNVPGNKVVEKVHMIMYSSIMIGIVSVLVIMAVVYFITGRAVKPILQAVGFAENMSKGDFSQTLATNRKDEIGTLVAALNNMVSSLGGMFRDSEEARSITREAVTLAASSSEKVKALARQTADATNEIRVKIDGIQDSTTDTVTEIEHISNVIVSINEIVSHIAGEVEEQSIATKDISENVGQASQGIREVSGNVAQSSTVAREITHDIVGVNQVADEISESSSHVNGSAIELSNLSEHLKAMVEKFKI